MQVSQRELLPVLNSKCRICQVRIWRLKKLYMAFDIETTPAQSMIEYQRILNSDDY